MEIDAKRSLKNLKKSTVKTFWIFCSRAHIWRMKKRKKYFSLDIPGLDEVMGLKKITDFMESNEYGLYIVDTAPTGHTLRLLSLPELLDDWIKFLASLRWKYHAMIRQFAREERVENADKFLLEMKKTVKKCVNFCKTRKEPNLL